MSKTDSIGDAFTIIRNAVRVKKEEATLVYSKPVLEICRILKQEGYLDNFKTVDLERFQVIKVYLKYDGKKSLLSQIKRVSKPGRRVYRKGKEIPQALGGYGITIVSTSAGIFTDREAKDKGVGGEVIGMVW